MTSNRMRRLWLATLSALSAAVLTACSSGGSMAPPSTPAAPAGGPATGMASSQQMAPTEAASAKDSGGWFGGGEDAQPSAPPPPAAAAPSPMGQPGSSGGSAPAATSGPRSEAKPSKAPAAEGASRRKSEADVAPDPADRPGLGTQWGETRSSRISTVPFVRADASNPFATSALFYNDEEGAQAMSAQSGFQRWSGGAFKVANGVVTVGLRDDGGRFLSGFTAGGKNFIVGEAGRRYTIVLKNLTPARFECVVSVDGLDVLDGKPASFGKRGYLLDPNGELEIDGWRTSTEAVAAFRFGSVRGSYANQKGGDTRNVGVIGVALFHERGSNPLPWTQEEVDRRRDANPFPGQFATPPGQ